MAETDIKALEMRCDMVRQALEAESVMGEPAMKVAPIEGELRTYAHDIVRANHDKDFRSLAAFPLAELEDCKLVVVRADYKGDVMWQPNGWVLWTLIWRGHMLLLEPPAIFRRRSSSNDGNLTTHRHWVSYSFGILAMIRSAQPQVLSFVVCAGVAGDLEHGPCRRTSNLAAAAIVGCIKAGYISSTMSGSQSARPCPVLPGGVCRCSSHVRRVAQCGC